MELVHDDRKHILEGKVVGMQQSIQQDLGHDDENRGIGVHLAVPSDQSDVVCREAPPHRRLLQLSKLLLGERDQRRGVIGPAACPQRLVQRCLGNDSFPRPGRSTDQHPLLRREPREQSFFLYRVGIEFKLVQVFGDEIVPRRCIHVGLAGGRASGRV